MGFSRQEYWSGLPFQSPGALPHPGIKPGSPALQVDFRFFSIIGYYKILNIVPCDILGNLFVYLFFFVYCLCICCFSFFLNLLFVYFIYSSVYLLTPNSLIYSSPAFSPLVTISFFFLFVLYFCCV